MSLGAAAAFFAQVLDEEAQALIEIEFLEELLPADGIADEGRGDEVGEHFRIGHLTQITIDLFRQFAFAAFEPRIEFQHLRGERVGLDGRLGARFERLDARNRKGGFLLETR